MDLREERRQILAGLRQLAGLPTTEARLDELAAAFSGMVDATIRLRQIDTANVEPAPIFRAAG